MSKLLFRFTIFLFLSTYLSNFETIGGVISTDVDSELHVVDTDIKNDKNELSKTEKLLEEDESPSLVVTPDKIESEKGLPIREKRSPTPNYGCYGYNRGYNRGYKGGSSCCDDSSDCCSDGCSDDCSDSCGGGAKKKASKKKKTIKNNNYKKNIKNNGKKNMNRNLNDNGGEDDGGYNQYW